jgi:hypothetical protein
VVRFYSSLRHFKAADAALYRAKSEGGNAYDLSGRVTQASPPTTELQHAI